MIDPTKSPTPAWKRYATIALLAVLLVFGVYMIYTKDIKKPSSGSAAPPPAVSAVSNNSASPSKVTTSTTLVIPDSSRDPFAP